MSVIPFQQILDKILYTKGILHLGGYNGDDKSEYDRYGISNVLYVEPNPILFEKLEKKVGRENCVQMAVCHKDDLEVDFNLYYSKDRSNLGCSSLFKWSGLKQNQHIEECGIIKVKTIKIDTLLRDRLDIDFINMDIQGAELHALYGAKKVLPQINCILTEFSIQKDYQDACLLYELDDFLLPKGFQRVITEFATKSWGDCVFIRKERVS